MQSDIIIVAYIGEKCKSRVARMMIRLRRNDGEFPLCENFPINFTFAFGEHRVLTYRKSGANISCFLIEKAERGSARL